MNRAENSQTLPPFSEIYHYVFSGEYGSDQKLFLFLKHHKIKSFRLYNDFATNVANVSEYCYYRSSLEKITNNSAETEYSDADEYVDLYLILPMYYKGEDEKSALTCFENASLVCAPMHGKQFDTCDNFQDLLDCYLSIYDRQSCPSKVRSEFCHLITTDLKRDEVIDLDCFTQLDQTCTSAKVSILFGTFIFIIIHFGTILL